MELENLPFTVIKDCPAGFIDEYAIIGDIHLGFEDDLSAKGYNVYDKTDEFFSRIKNLRAKKLIMLGDIRTSFNEILPREGGVLLKFLSELSYRFEEVVITKGNHDGGLSKLTSRFMNVSLVPEFKYNDVGFIHGHMFPSKKLTAEITTLCMGHLHPAITMTDSNGVTYRKDCWMLFDMKLPSKIYPKSKIKYGVGFPKFNSYIGNTDLIKKEGVLKYATLSHRLSIDLVLV